MVRKGLGIALILAAAVGIVAVVSKRRDASAEDHLRAYYAAERNCRVVSGGIGVPKLRDRLARRWYIWRGKGSVEFLNEMAKHHKALEDLGYLETRLFVCTNKPALEVAANVRTRASPVFPIHGLNALANIWYSPTNRVYVLAPKADMPQWERWIQETDVPE